MIDLTPLDVRKKRGDFAKGVRGYNVQEVDSFLELVAERLEELVKENLTLHERVDRLAEQVTAQTGRERAVHEALVTAQQLREDIQNSAQEAANRIIREAEARGAELLADAERRVADRAESLHELERRRKRFLATFRQFLEQEMDSVAVEEGRETVAREQIIDMDLGPGRPVGADPRPDDDIHALAGDELDAGGGPRAGGDGAAATEAEAAPVDIDLDLLGPPTGDPTLPQNDLWKADEGTRPGGGPPSREDFPRGDFGNA
jgi:cell division initiation protein